MRFFFCIIECLLSESLLCGNTVLHVDLCNLVSGLIIVDSN